MSQALDPRRVHAIGGRTLVSFLAAWVCFAMASSAGAQTLSEYSRAQRAVLEAEMARNVAKALSPSGTPGAPAAGAPPSGGAPMPGHPMPSQAMFPPASPPPLMAPASKEILVTGVIALAHRSMAELSYLGETYLLLPGDPLPGTGWVVASIDASRVVLKSGRSRTRNLPVSPTGGR